MEHGDVEVLEDTARVYCATHGLVMVEKTNWPLWFADEHNQTTGCLPEIDDPREAVALARRLASGRSEAVSVFRDRGWGADPERISIVVDGDGKNPRARLTQRCFHALLEENAVGPNVLSTFKARGLHDFAMEPLGQ